MVGFATVIEIRSTPSQTARVISKRGCQIVAEQSGHVVAIDQPQVVVDAIRAIVDVARGGTMFRFAALAVLPDEANFTATWKSVAGVLVIANDLR